MRVGLLGNIAVVRSNDEYSEGRPDVVALTEDTGDYTRSEVCDAESAKSHRNIKTMLAERSKR